MLRLYMFPIGSVSGLETKYVFAPSTGWLPSSPLWYLRTLSEPVINFDIDTPTLWLPFTVIPFEANVFKLPSMTVSS